MILIVLQKERICYRCGELIAAGKKAVKKTQKPKVFKVQTEIDALYYHEACWRAKHE